MNYNQLFDHTILKADASPREIKQLCDEAIKYNFFSVCVNPSYVKYVQKQLINSNVAICTVVGFPLGQTSTKQKVYEAKTAIKDGANEIDMVLNVAEFKENCACVVNEIRMIKKVCKKLILKVIVETALLTNDEIAKATLVVIEGGADFIKTSTGFASRGASVQDIEIMKNTIVKNNSNLLIKASGGIKTFEAVQALVKAGANRIGSSRSVEIIKQISNSN